MRLLDWAGLNRCRISRATGIPRSTIRDLLSGSCPSRGSEAGRRRSPTRDDLLGEWNLDAYSYALGIYLGDGHIVIPSSGVPVLRISLDSGYPEIVESTRCALSRLLPMNRITPRKHPAHNLVEVKCSSKALLELFPQHGPGRKHTRDVSLRPWQLKITRRYPRDLVRGLIHSDGCRFVARQPKGDRFHVYARYCFKNRSADIMRIFCSHLDLLGINWTLSSWETAQIAQRESVARLDEFVGPKR